MTHNVRINLKVLIFDRDFYALQAINSYMAWDRRTRVVAMVHSLEEVSQYVGQTSVAELPDVVLLEGEAFPTPAELRAGIEQLRHSIPDVMVLCMGHIADGARAAAAYDAGARGYLLRNEVTVYVVGAVLYALEHKFIVTPGIREAAGHPYDTRIFNATVLPSKREYPGMTDRVRQALWLCVIEGLPAQLAADEMGVSPHTVRSYIKEGYRILEAYDDTDYPEEMGPLERAFMRFTALENDEETEAENKNSPEE
jgi:DNA-binding NarL/FixJ family response regulator